MAKKTEAKSEKIEREYTIPLREKVRVVPRYKKTNKAVKTVKEFLAQHMKIRDRDLNKIKIDKYLNEALWFRGIRKPPYKIKVKAIKDGEIVRAELAEFPDNLKFKKAREEKMLQKMKELIEGKKSKMAKAKEAMSGKGAETGGEETQTAPKEGVPSDTQRGTSEGKDKKAEEKEKKSAVVEAGAKMEKAAAQMEKKSAKASGKMVQQKHQVRKALAK